MRNLQYKDDGTPCLRSLSLRVEEAERLGNYTKAIKLLEMLVMDERRSCAKVARDMCNINAADAILERPV